MFSVASSRLIPIGTSEPVSESQQSCRRSSCPLPKRSKGVSSFVSPHWRPKPAWIWFLVSIEWRSSPASSITSIVAG